MQPVVLSVLPGKGLSAEKPLADLIFCYFLIKQKVMGLRGQERGKLCAGRPRSDKVICHPNKKATRSKSNGFFIYFRSSGTITL
jgi:hypothetical protein